MTRTVLALLIALTVNAVSVNGQSLFNQPESVAYDEANDRYLVSNYGDGNIIAVDHNKNATLWYSGLLHAMGCEIAGNRLYVSVYGNRVIGINLTTKTTEWQINASSLQNLDGITWDGGNYLYVVDTYGRILKADIASQTYENFVTGLSPGIQDIVYDGAHNRLLIGAYYADNSVLAVDLTTRSVTTAMLQDPGYLDGICLGDNGKVYLSSHAWGGTVQMWDGEYSSMGTLVIASLNQPAGCCYNFVDGELAIARFGGGTMAYVSFSDPDNDLVPEYRDNCPETYNPDQADADGDGIGDACDPCTDSDFDGYAEPGYPASTCALDNCPNLQNPDQSDLDADNIGDECDNCWLVYNPGQEDRDSDGFGDACDGCCIGRVGDANGAGTYPQEVTISDIQLLVTAKFIVGSCAALPCLAECDVNQSGLANPQCQDITIADIQTLVNHLFIAGPTNAPLKSCL